MSMLAVAITHVGTTVDDSFETGLLKHFEGFQVVRLRIREPTAETLAETRLQICEPEKEGDLLRVLREDEEPAGPWLELQGPREKLQKAVRSLFFPGREPKYERVLLTGCEGIADFPWALQIVCVHLPVPGWEQNPEWVRKADVIVLRGSEGEESRRLTAGIKTLRPDVPLFGDGDGQGWAVGLRGSLEGLFAAYGEKRRRIKERLEAQQAGRQLECERARKLAETLGVDLSLVGSVCDESGYRITRCGLGCF
jgi:hypothetical protein